ncbi:MAG TPA: Gfo/Idh/MocA family oxidoreductase [Bryobacteraceae bacterium]|nr:Gfo/Idh/MocA family oxidoreductase [Bryobacteraceae bacterium]
MYSRRDVLKTAAAMPALLAAQSPNETIRVAVIGVGGRGTYDLKNVLKVPGVKVVALCDLDEARLARASALVSATGDAPATYTDFRKMLDERKDIDATIIATPVDTHKMIAIDALEVGNHVYCEKPMATTPQDVRLMAAAAKSAKGIFQSGFQLRHDPNRSAAMKFIHSGGIGKVLFLQGYRHTGDLPREVPWYFDRTRSGDNIVEQACHILDLFVWTAGQHPLRAYGSGGINLFKDEPPGRTTMDNYAVIYEFPNDLRLEFSHIYFDPPGFSGIKERVYGAKGAVDLPSATWIEREKKGEIKLDVPDAGQDSTYLSIAAFIDNARGRKTPLNNADSAALSTLVAMMGRKSIYERRIVTWEEMSA